MIDLDSVRRLDALYQAARDSHDPAKWATYHRALRAASDAFGVPFRPAEFTEDGLFSQDLAETGIPVRGYR